MGTEPHSGLRLEGADRIPIAAIVVLVIAALSLVAYFDLATNLAFNDEWMFRWSAQRMATGHGLQLWPQVVPVSLVQTLASMPVAILHAEPRFLRLTVLPFMVLWSVMSWLIAKHLGAGRFWSTVAAVVVPLAPLTLWVSASFMSDIAYLALLMTAAWIALRWIESGEGGWWLVAAVALATAQRQQGVSLAIAATAAVLLMRRQRRPRDLQVLLATWLAAVAVLATPFLTGIASNQMTTVLHNTGTQQFRISALVLAILQIGPMLALGLFPLGLGLLSRTDAERTTAGRWELVPLGLAGIGVVAAVALPALFGLSIWPGEFWGVWGRGPLYIGGNKPGLYPALGFATFEGLLVAFLVVLLGWRFRSWVPRALGSGGIFLVVLGLGHVPPMALASPTDRYYLPVIAVLAPLAAAQISRAEVPGRLAFAARAWCLLALSAGLACFVAGEQDYVSWQTARAQAQAYAYGLAGVAGVDAGFEANASALAIPRYEATGQLIDSNHLAGLEPSLALGFAARDDPRPGFVYSSLAPGKIIIVCLRPPPSCPLTAPK